MLSFYAHKQEEEEAEQEAVENLSNSDVTTKYQEAAKIANLALQGVTQQCMPGARINDLCKFGDNVIVQVGTTCGWTIFTVLSA